MLKIKTNLDMLPDRQSSETTEERICEEF